MGSIMVYKGFRDLGGFGFRGSGLRVQGLGDKDCR